MIRLLLPFGSHESNPGKRHVPLSLCRFRHESGRASRLFVPVVDDAMAYPWLEMAMTDTETSPVCRTGNREKPRRLLEQLFIRKERSASPVGLWVGRSLALLQRFGQNGASIIIERRDFAVELLN